MKNKGTIIHERFPTNCLLRVQEEEESKEENRQERVLIIIIIIIIAFIPPHLVRALSAYKD